MMEEFEALLEESFEMDTPEEGPLSKARSSRSKRAKPSSTWATRWKAASSSKNSQIPGEAPEIAVGDEVEVFLRAAENARGEAVISREMARREEAWDRLEKAYAAEERVEGAIFGRVKGGFTVDLGGAVAFLPGSQVDVRPVRDAGPSDGSQAAVPDPENGPPPGQHRCFAPRDPRRIPCRTARRSDRQPGRRSEVDGVVKNITEYGAFVDLGGVDGLLHVTDMAWRRVNHPSEILTIGETIKVQVIKINKETHRISLGMKQLQEDPWDLVAAKYPLESTHRAA